jgi:hypothetical protein
MPLPYLKLAVFRELPLLWMGVVIVVGLAIVLGIPKKWQSKGDIIVDAPIAPLVELAGQLRHYR